MLKASGVAIFLRTIFVLMPTLGFSKNVHELLWENSLKIYADYEGGDVCCDPDNCSKINCPEDLTLTAEGINPPFCFLLPMGLSNGIERKLERVKKESFFKDGYGFIHTPCDCSAHGGNGFMAFKLSDKTSFLGYLQAEEEPYSDGKFYGTYEPLEEYGFGSHAESPSVELVMREMNGDLNLDATETWDKNKLRLEKSRQAVQSYAGGKSDLSSEAYRNLRVAVLDGAQILKYLNRHDELAEWFRLSKMKLSSEDFSELKCLLEAVHPLETVLDEGETCGTYNNRSHYNDAKEAIDKCHGVQGLSTDEWMARLKQGDRKAPEFLSERAAELANRIPELREIFLASKGMQTFDVAYLMKDVGPKIIPVFKAIVENRGINCNLRDEALSGMGWTKGGEQDAMKEAVWAWKEDRDCLGRTSISIFSENSTQDPVAEEALLAVLADPMLAAKLDAEVCGTKESSSQIVGWAIRGLAKYPSTATASAVCTAMEKYKELGQGTYALGEIARRLKVSPHSLCNSLK